MTSDVVIEYAEPLYRIFTSGKRIKIAVGGRGSMKSTGVGGYVLGCMNEGQLWCCAREQLNSIEESVHRLMLDEIGRLGFHGFEDTKKGITHAATGGRNFYKGLSRNLTSLKSTFTGVDGIWIEEGESLSEDSLRIMTASVRLSAKDAQRVIAGEEVKMPEIIITMNRGSRNDPVSKKWLERAEPDLQRKGWYEDDIIMVVQMNHSDVPDAWFSASGLEIERQDDLRMMTDTQYNHKWNGDYMDEIEDSIILQSWFNACIDAHTKLGFKPRGARIASYDPSDGGDAVGYSLRHGGVLLDCREITGQEVNDSCDVALDLAIEANADLFTWDGDGLGVSLRRQITGALKGKRIDHDMFKGSNSVDDPSETYQAISDEEYSKKKTNEDTFRNKRAQYYWRLRDRIYSTYRAVEHGEYIDPEEMISFSSKIDCINKLRAELCSIPRKRTGSGLIQIMSKDEMKSKYGIISPNLADSAMMSMLVPKVRRQKTTAKPRVSVC